MDLSSTVTASTTGLSLLPRQVGQGTSRMYPSKRSRLESLSESWWRRLTNGMAPSNWAL